MTNFMKFTLSQIKYLICLYRLSANGCGVKNIELANALGLSKPSVHYIPKRLMQLYCFHTIPSIPNEPFLKELDCSG